MPQTPFIKSWTPEQFAIAEKAIQKHFRKGWTACNNWLGLAYTSSSDYAGYWVCNVELPTKEDENYKYIGFAIGADNSVFAVAWDKEENEKIIKIN